MTIDEYLQKLSDVALQLKNSKHSDQLKAMLINGFLSDTKSTLKKIKQDLE